jgi:hypothetical protein
MALSKADILGANDIKITKVDVPEWGGEVYVRTLKGVERDQFEDQYQQSKMQNFRARFLVLALCDEAGVRVFSDDDAKLLAEKSSAVLGSLFDKAWEINAMSTKAVDDLGNG